jgi:hypothetical protein
MRTLFAVPWLTPGGRNLLISLLSSLVVVFGAFALLKFNISGKRAPQELVTGSIQKSAVRRSASNDPMAAFLITPSVAAATQGMKQMAVGFSSPIPLPRPRPKRL